MQFQDAPRAPGSQELGYVLRDLSRNKYPHVPNPPGCRKRAAVALIIRVRPTFPDRALFDASTCGPAAGSGQERLQAFFAQEWVQRGDPEVLFIKRAAREGDRWTSHIAFPGGRRDPEDQTDIATSIRETREEIGMELEAEHCMNVGNLSERIVTTWLGKTPLMVLCPFLFLQMRVDTEPLTLQPTEVHSAHWVPLRALTSPYLNTYIHSDVSGRFGRSDNGLFKSLARFLFGQVLIKGIDLVPTESVYCNSSADLLPSGPRASTQKMQEMESSNPTAKKETGKASGPGEIDDTTFTTFQARSRKEIQDSALLEMLGGYYDRAKTAVFLTLLLRIGAGGLLAAWGVRELRNRRSQKLYCFHQ
ncbi:MAG: hypothetical protein Q9166_006606 [cf. Caloplaca sp. 2 TL-2023]